MKLFITFLFLVNLVSAQDTTFVKSFYGGSTIIVPANKNWFIEKAFISSGDGYNIQINLSHFKSEYKSEETLQIPFYIPEMELLSDKNMVNYILSIKENVLFD